MKRSNALCEESQIPKYYFRSFSDDLFTQAIHVLQKIGVSKEFLQKFNDLQEKFKVTDIMASVDVFLLSMTDKFR